MPGRHWVRGRKEGRGFRCWRRAVSLSTFEGRGKRDEMVISASPWHTVSLATLKSVSLPGLSDLPHSGIVFIFLTAQFMVVLRLYCFSKKIFQNDCQFWLLQIFWNDSIFDDTTESILKESPCCPVQMTYTSVDKYGFLFFSYTPVVCPFSIIIEL